LLILLGVGEGDTELEAQLLAAKILRTRIFTDDEDKMNPSVTDVGGGALVVSNFTLLANYRRGNRPDFMRAAKPEEAKRLYGIEFVDMAAVENMDAVILAVAHEQFKSLTVADFDKFYGQRKKVLIDVKSILDKKTFDEAGYVYWRL
jgi:D-tyrosyl-tRNA(Tyr) deacylase